MTLRGQGAELRVVPTTRMESDVVHEFAASGCSLPSIISSVCHSSWFGRHAHGLVAIGPIIACQHAAVVG
jgi:hypothetical protein